MMTEDFNTSVTPPLHDKQSHLARPTAEAASGVTGGIPEAPVLPSSYTIAVPSATVPASAPSISPVESGEYIVTNPMLFPKLYLNDMFLSLRQNRLFKFHAIAAVILNSACLVAWFFSAFFFSMYPWFLFVWSVTGLTLTSHYYVFVRSEPQLLPLHVTWYGILNTTVFAAWLFSNSYGKAWFVEFATATLILLASHYTLALNKQSEHKWIYLHATLFSTINLFLFSLWMDIGKGYPWFMYVLAASAMLLAGHYIFHFQAENLLLKLHGVLYAGCMSILFIAWATTTRFPWIAFPLVIWGALLGVHAFLIYRRDQSQTKAATGA